jgi:hypothetical protein
MALSKNGLEAIAHRNRTRDFARSYSRQQEMSEIDDNSVKEHIVVAKVAHRRGRLRLLTYALCTFSKGPAKCG